MRFPIDVPHPDHSGRRAPALRAATLGVAALLVAALTAAPLSAHAEESGASEPVAGAPVADAASVEVPHDDPVDPSGSAAATPDPAEHVAPSAPEAPAPPAAPREIAAPVEQDAAAASAPVPAGAGPANGAPTAVDDHYSMTQGEVLDVPAPGFLANDSDPDGDPIVGHSTDSELGDGFAWFPYGGAFAYEPDPAFIGTYVLAYSIRDDSGAVSNWATITVEVLPSDDQVAPVIPNLGPVASDDAYSTPMGTTLTVPSPGVLGNDSDPDGDPLKVQGHQTPWHGWLALEADGTMTYTPKPGFAGTDTFSYGAFDGELYSWAEITVEVTPVAGSNTAPAAEDDEFTAVAGTPLVIGDLGLLANDSDADGDPIGITAITQSPVFGSIDLAADGSSVTYTPGPGHTGTDEFRYEISDGEYTDTARVVITTVAPEDPCAPHSTGTERRAAAIAIAVPAPECEPTEPTDPLDPAEPAEPSQPSEHVELPVEPARPAAPRPAALPASTLSLAETGSDTRLAIALAAMLAALGLVLRLGGRRTAR